MKKPLLIVSLSIGLIFQASGQINPVNNLEWNHWYVCPHNYFILSWDLPNPSSDTLIGYHIYRESDLYRFQEETSLYHTDTASNCGEDFVFYNGGTSFWMHVTAIYNTGHIESGYNDSAYCYGFAIGIEEPLQPGLRLFPNPTAGMLKIDSGTEIVKVTIVNPSGKVVDVFHHTNDLDLSHLAKGIYHLRILTGGTESHRAVMVE